MSTKKLLALLIAILSAIGLSAQVTGNVKLADIYNNLEADHSGVIVSFLNQSGTAVADTAFTDVNGNFSINLAPGTYLALYSKPGYVRKYHQRKNSFIAPNFTLSSDVLYKELPVITITDSISGNLLPFTHYRIIDSLVVPAGDTLIVPEGSWLNYHYSAVKIYGVLKLMGSSSYPAILTPVDTLANPTGYGSSIGQAVQIMAGGEIYFDKATQMHDNWIVSTLGKLTIENYHRSFPLPRQIDSSSYPGLKDFDIRPDNSEINISESEIKLRIEAYTANDISITCSYILPDFDLNGGYFNFINNRTPAGRIEVNGMTEVNFTDNYLQQTDIYLKNNISNDTTDVFFTNNSFLQSFINLADQIDDINVRMTNNAGFTFGSFGAQAATISEFDYNLLYTFSSGGFYKWLPDSAMTPPGVARIDGLWVNDSTDILFNRFITNNVLWSQLIYDSAFAPHPNAVAMLTNQGDPMLLDPDGTRSDKGARPSPFCFNPLLPQPDSTIVFASDSVYPGDANYDGIADNVDVLPIGVKFGSTGPLRPNASLVWTGHYCDPWNDSLASNVNIKHTDCNGDGTINYTDVNAIYQNYGLTHAVLKAPPFGDGLWLQFPSDSVFEGDTVEVKVMLGNNSLPVNNIYGLAFSITYDSVFIKPGSASMNFQQCWLGTDSVDMISFFKELPAVSRYDIALSRTDMQTISGDGQIGTLVVVINDDIQAKDPMTLTTQMGFTGIYAINQVESPLNIGSASSTFNIEIGRDTTGTYIMGGLDDISLAVYPNPARDKLTVTVMGNREGNIAIISAAGNIVRSLSLTEGAQTIDVSNVPNGLYLLKLQTTSGIICRKVMIAR